jgi:hypothetical protein
MNGLHLLSRMKDLYLQTGQTDNFIETKILLLCRGVGPDRGERWAKKYPGVNV